MISQADKAQKKIKIDIKKRVSQTKQLKLNFGQHHRMRHAYVRNAAKSWRI